MSLPETIPFCPVHGEPWNDHEGACNQWLAAPDDSDCAVEWLRVAGRDDLLIRRDEATVERIAISLWLNEGPKDAGETWNNQDDITRGFYRSMAGEALAAAEGGEE